MQLSNSCLNYLFCSFLPLHSYCLTSAVQRERPWGLMLPCRIKMARGWTSWRHRSCANKGDEVHTCTQQGIRNGLGETMCQTRHLNGQGAQQLLACGKKNFFFPSSSSSVAMSAPIWMWWGIEGGTGDFQGSFPGMCWDIWCLIYFCYSGMCLHKKFKLT